VKRLASAVERPVPGRDALLPPRRPPVGASITRVGIVLALAFAVLAAGAGYWQVLDASTLSAAPDNPAVILAARNAVRGRILDRTGVVLATSKRNADGTPVRVYVDDTVAPVVGYASAQFGTAGLERAYNTALLGLPGSDPIRDLLRKFDPNPNDPQDLRLSLSLPLQRAAVAGLGQDIGAVVMMNPRTGEVLAMASTPTWDASAVADPTTAAGAFATLRADTRNPLLLRPTQGLYVPGSVFKIVTAVAGLGSGAIQSTTTFPQQPAAEANGLVVDGFRVRDGHHPFTGSAPLDFAHALEVSCNIWFALGGLATGGAALTDWASRLGFGAPIPFDLPTASSQVTNGGGSLGGGFTDRVELANAAYGQGETQVTPLQMALVAATIANGGVLVWPRLVTSLTSARTGAHEVAQPAGRRVLPADEAGIIRDAMRQAVEGDWGRQFTTGAAVPGIPTAGKSGTAQLGGTGEPNSWFIGFAPADDPQIAIAVVVEHGGRGGERAAPLAGQLMTAFFALPK
jgi:peptidoglycan glycosyltransferase